MNTGLIAMSLAGGGQMTIKAVMPRKSIFIARMDWPGEEPVVGSISTSVEGAIDNLDSAIYADAENQRVIKGGKP